MLSTFYYKGRQAAANAIATVNSADGESFSAAGDCLYKSLPMFAPKGYYALPAENDRILVTTADGAEAAAGVLMSTAGLSAGEIKIINQSGASIILKNNGSIAVNGVIISPDGEIVCKKITAAQGGV